MATHTNAKIKCLPCLVGNYEVVCDKCEKGYCHTCLLRDPDTGDIDCPFYYENGFTKPSKPHPDRNGHTRHNYKYIVPQPDNVIVHLSLRR